MPARSVARGTRVFRYTKRNPGDRPFVCLLEQKDCGVLSRRKKSCKRKVTIGLPPCWQHLRSHHFLRVGDATNRLHGKGLFAWYAPAEKMPPAERERVRVFHCDDVIGEYTGEVLGDDEVGPKVVDHRYGKGADEVGPYVISASPQEEEASTQHIDAACSRSTMSLINHPPDGALPNVIMRAVRSAETRKMHVIMKALRPICHGEELYCDYGNDYWGVGDEETPCMPRAPSGYRCAEHPVVRIARTGSAGSGGASASHDAARSGHADNAYLAFLAAIAPHLTRILPGDSKMVQKVRHAIMYSRADPRGCVKDIVDALRALVYEKWQKIRATCQKKQGRVLSHVRAITDKICADEVPNTQQRRVLAGLLQQRRNEKSHEAGPDTVRKRVRQLRNPTFPQNAALDALAALCSTAGDRANWWNEVAARISGIGVERAKAMELALMGEALGVDVFVHSAGERREGASGARGRRRAATHRAMFCVNVCEELDKLTLGFHPPQGRAAQRRKKRARSVHLVSSLGIYQPLFKKGEDAPATLHLQPLLFLDCDRTLEECAKGMPSNHRTFLLSEVPRSRRRALVKSVEAARKEENAFRESAHRSSRHASHETRKKGTRASRERAASIAVNVEAWSALLHESDRSGSSDNGRDGAGASSMWREARQLQEEKERRLAEEMDARVQTFREEIDECVTRIRQQDNDKAEDSALKARYKTESARKEEHLLHVMKKKLTPKQTKELTARLDVIREQSWSTFQGERDALRRKVLEKVSHFNADLDKKLGRLKQSTWHSRVSASLKGKKTKEPREEYDDIYEETKRAIIPEEASQLRRAFDRYLGQHKEHTWRNTVEAMRQHERAEREKTPPAADNPYLRSEVMRQ